MKRILGLAILVAMLAPAAHAADAIVRPLPRVTVEPFEDIPVDVTSDADGDATITLQIYGHVLGIITDPGAGDAAPTDNWDVTLIDERGLDLLDPDTGVSSATTTLAGVGINRDTSTTEMVEAYRVNAAGTFIGYPIAMGPCVLTMAGMGDANTARVIVRAKR
jgi:hypothetical protein